MEYPNSGGLFTTKQKRHEKAPDMFGDIDLDREYVLALLEKSQGASSIKVKLDAWLRKDKNGNRMVSLKVDTYEKDAQPKTSAKDPWDD